MQPERLVSIDPCTAETVWEGESGDPAAAVAQARAAFPGWAAAGFETRAALARRYAETVKADGEAFARLISRETGKPLWEARTEVSSVVNKVEISISAYAERTGDKRGALPDGVRTRLAHKPHGVMAVIGPYNFPAHLPNGHIAPALLAGDTVVFKPSEHTPATAEAMAGYWRAAGLPEGALVLTQGGGGVGKALLAQDVDGVLFTGSASTGAAIHRAFGGRPEIILALEMGGNNPLIVWDAADAAAAAGIAVQSAYLSAGQRCTCARRLIIPHGAEGSALLREIAGLAGRLIAGAPFDEPQPFMGPVIANIAADQLEAAAARLIEAGAGVILPLERRDPGRPYLSPALLDVTGLSPLPDEELFGPVLQVQRADDFDHALHLANATRFGLAAGLISDDEALYRRFWAASRAGVVNWNRPLTGAASAAPFGGIGASGNHRPSAYYAADYAAYPVASLEADAIATQAIPGLR